MPDPVAPIETPVAAVQEAVAAVPAAAPVVEAAPAAPVAPPAEPVAEAAPAAPAPEAPAQPEAAAAKDSDTDLTLFEKFEKEKADKAAAEKAKAPEAPAEEAKATSETPDAPPSYADFTLPEGVAPDKEALSAYTGALGKYRVSQEGGQELLDLHVKSLQAYAEHVDRHQVDVFNDTRKGWQAAVMADPELGGAGFNTAMDMVAKARDQFVPEKDRAEFNAFLKYTGAGDNPAYLRTLYRAGQFIDQVQQFLREPGAESLPSNIRPPPNHGRQEPRSLRDIYRQTAEAAGR